MHAFHIKVTDIKIEEFIHGTTLLYIRIMAGNFCNGRKVWHGQTTKQLI